METGSSRSQSEAWKNEGGWGEEDGVWDEAALCVHIQVCVCVCVAGSPRVPPTTWVLYILHLLLLLPSALLLPIPHLCLGPINLKTEWVVLKTFNCVALFELLAFFFSVLAHVWVKELFFFLS